MSIRRLPDIPTPALIIDAGALGRNIARMAEFFSAGPCRLRPHFKAHKTPEIARRQLAAGSTTGLTCATVTEAETVAPFCDDILVANEVVSQDKCRRLAALAGRCHLTVAIDSLAGLEVLGEAVRSVDVTIGVLVDVNVGQNRCGVSPGADALRLAKAAATTPGIVLRGVMGYEGHVQPVADRAERARQARGAMEELVSTADLLRQEGLRCEIVSGGGTGTFDISGRMPGVTEIQAGSYALMDSDYGRLDLPFEQALFVLGTVVSRPSVTRLVADCGHKSCSKDHGNPTVWGLEGTTVTSLNDEHVTVMLTAVADIRVGQRVWLRPSHVDPTMNLHDVAYAIEGDEVVGVWPIARGYEPLT